MYFQLVKIEDWAGLFDREIVLELEKGLNLILGPNESGKSTLLNALKLALTSKASSKRKEVRNVQPWDTELKPSIELCFHANGKNYRLRKTYLKSKDNAAFSEQLDDGGWITVGKDNEAHNRFLKTLDSSEGEGFFNTLWVPQGQSIDIDTSQGLTDRIKEAVGSVTSAIGDEILAYAVDRVGNENNNGWLTPTTRRVSSGSPWDKAETKLTTLKEEMQGLKEQLEDHQENLTDIHNIKDEKKKLEESLEEERNRLNTQQKKKQEWDEFFKVKNKKDGAEKRVDQLWAIKEDWDKKLSDIEETVRKTDVIQKKIDKLKKDKKTVSAKEERAREKWKSRNSSLARQKARLDYVKRLRAQKLNAEIAAIEEDLQGLGDIDAEAFSSWKRLKEETESKKNQLEASELKIEFEAKRNLAGHITLDGEKEPLDLSPEDRIKRTAAKSLEIELDELGKLSVETAMKKALDAKKAVEENEARLNEIYQDYDVDNWGELKNLYASVNEKRGKRDNLSNLLQQIGVEEPHDVDGSTVESFVEDSDVDIDRGFINEKLDEEHDMLAEESKDLSEELDVLEDEVDELEEDWQEKKVALKEIKVRISDKEHELKVEERGLDEKYKALTEIKERAKNADESLDDIPLPQQPEDDFSREEEESSELYRALKGLWRDARREHQGLEDDVKQIRPSGEEVTEEMISEIHDRIGKLNNRINDKKIDIGGLKGKIGETADGLHEKIRDKKEEIERQRRKLESAKKETRAHELLRLTLTESKEKTSSEYLEPIRQKVDERLREMTDERYTEAKLDSNLTPDSAVSGLRNTTASSEDLSFGTKEQFSFLTRLAMAETVSRRERIPVIFDDSLVNTDPGRMTFMRKYLTEASSSVQVMIFTCNPDDYRFDGDYNVIELDRLP
ncbi:MAG: AAA family ATPase [Candidatus Acetothermia bacterium]